MVVSWDLGGDFDFKHFKMLNSPGSARGLHRQNIDRWIMIVSNLLPIIFYIALHGFFVFVYLLVAFLLLETNRLKDNKILVSTSWIFQNICGSKINLNQIKKNVNPAIYSEEVSKQCDFCIFANFCLMFELVLKRLCQYLWVRIVYIIQLNHI